MGQVNCGNCSCGLDSDLKSEFEISDEGGSRMTDVYASPKKSPVKKMRDYNDFALHEHKIIKIQAAWRGYSMRKVFLYLLSNHNKNRLRQRKGPHTYANGAVYTGEWVGRMRDGYGEQKWVDSAQYLGYWRNDKTNGHGKFIHVDGDMYEGNWVDDQATGKGVYQHLNGARYEGDWENEM